MRFKNPVRKRRGVILLIVMAMLALFASVGLTFVFYAESQADVSRTTRQVESQFRANVEPELLLNHFLGQQIYDTSNLYSSLRGHSFARTLFGADADREQAGKATGKNGVPFNGAGVLGYTHTRGPFAGLENRTVPNYLVHDLDNDARDPEWYGTRTDPARRFVGGGNPPTTYPSLNNCFLAAVNADGEVLISSYDRPWTGVDPLSNWRGDMSAAAKYKTFRPHPSYHTQFPDPSAGDGPDVKNLGFGRGRKRPTGGYFPNDSFWMYTGFPVLTAANGRKYTVLFAPLIIDLDNRINLLVHGNLAGPGQTHVSQHGLGRWEVNPTKVVDAAVGRTIVDAAEFRNFVAATRPNVPLQDTINNRYWWLAATRGGTAAPPSYSPFNFDSLPVAAGGGGPLVTSAPGAFSIFPTYPTGWDSGSAAEVTNHPAGYNYFGSPRLHASHMDALLNSYSKGSPALTSDLFRAFPQSLVTAGNPHDPLKLRTRNLLTTLSHDFDRPGLVPYLTSNSVYKYNDALKYPVNGPSVTAPAPTGGPQPFPDPGANVKPGGDFIDQSPTLGLYNATSPLKGRLNLNRKLTDYPPVDDPTGLIDSSDPNVQAALQERMQFARDLYDQLILVTNPNGDPNKNPAITDPATAEYKAARWLAQLAVNIVDYIDNDEYMTPFNWLNKEVVFGTEQSRLVINEAYLMYDNDPEDPGFNDDDPGKWSAQYYRLTCWAELYNPGEAPAAGYTSPREGGVARLANNRDPIYKLALSKIDPTLRTPENLIGTPGNLWQTQGMGGQPCVVEDWGKNGTIDRILPGGRRFNGAVSSNEGFLVVGPDVTRGKGKGKGMNGYLAGRNPGFPTSHTSNLLAAKVSTAEFAANPNACVILQRLACPHLPYDATTNPYVTVDYLDNLKVSDMRLYSDGGALPKPTQMSESASLGRKQPLAASLTVPQNPLAAGAPAGQPKNTFYRQNCVENTNTPPIVFDLKTNPTQTLEPFDWLPHLDRPLINPIELLHVSGYRPHELTQQFVTYPGGVRVPFDHRAPWFNEANPVQRQTSENSLIYRLLEVVTTPDLMNNTPIGGRVAGKININTIWDLDTFKALCDANGVSGFTDTEVTAIFQKLMGERTPGPDGLPGTADDGMPFTLDRPFSPLSIGISPGGGQYFYQTGISSTLLREKAGSPGVRLFDPEVAGRTHPYQRLELLTKIFNNVTTRSNCFAVWVTAGFFEVTDDTVNPPRIGAEIGKADNRHIRHKFFAIVDRTEIRARVGFLSNPTTERRLRLANNLTIAANATETIGTMTDNEQNRVNLEYPLVSGGTFVVTPGTYVTINPDGPNEETVKVDNAGGTSFSFRVTKNHAAGEEVIFRSWTGPWANYDVRRDERVVPYFTVLE